MEDHRNTKKCYQKFTEIYRTGWISLTLDNYANIIIKHSKTLFRSSQNQCVYLIMLSILISYYSGFTVVP